MPLSRELLCLSSSGGKGGRMTEEEHQWQFFTNPESSLNIDDPGSDTVTEKQQQGCIVTPTAAKVNNASESSSDKVIGQKHLRMIPIDLVY